MRLKKTKKLHFCAFKFIVWCPNFSFLGQTVTEESSGHIYTHTHLPTYLPTHIQSKKETPYGIPYSAVRNTRDIMVGRGGKTGGDGGYISPPVFGLGGMSYVIIPPRFTANNR